MLPPQAYDIHSHPCCSDCFIWILRWAQCAGSHLCDIHICVGSHIVRSKHASSGLWSGPNPGKMESRTVQFVWYGISSVKPREPPGTTLIDICRAGCWATPNTFARFYYLQVEWVTLANRNEIKLGAKNNCWAMLPILEMRVLIPIF